MLSLLDVPCIEADAAHVVEVMRAAEPAILENGEETFPAQGYLVLVKRESRQSVYAALHVRELQHSLICSCDEAATPEAAWEEARKFLTGIGFRLEPVSLKFSPAMREVILKEIPALLSPEAAQKIFREKEKRLADWRRLVDVPEGVPSANDAELSSTEWTKRKEEQDAREAARKTAAKHLAAEERMARKISTLREIVGRHLQQANAGEVAAAEKSERERVQALLADTQRMVTELRERVVRREKELVAAQYEKEQLQQAKTVAGALLEECRQQLAVARQARTRAEEERQIGELARKDAEKRLRAISESAQKMKEQLAAAEAERLRLTAAKEEAERQAEKWREEAMQSSAKGTAEAARQRSASEQAWQKVASLEEDLRQAQKRLAEGEAERTALARELAAALERVAAPAAAVAAPAISNEKEVEDLRRELRLAAEREAELRREIEALAAERAAAASISPVEPVIINEKEMEDLRRDLRRAGEREADLRREIEALAAAKTAAEKKLAGQEKTSTIATASSADGAVKTLEPRPPADPPPHVVRRPPPADAFFQVDWDLAGVPYDSPEEVCQIHKGINRVRLSLEGYPDQYCSAALIVTGTGEGKNVYIAFRLTESKRELIYIPRTPPETAAASAKAIREAEKFLRVVGLDLEPVPLSQDPRQRAKALEKVTFLLPPKKAGNF